MICSNFFSMLFFMQNISEWFKKKKIEYSSNSAYFYCLANSRILQVVVNRYSLFQNETKRLFFQKNHLINPLCKEKDIACKCNAILHTNEEC